MNTLRIMAMIGALAAVQAMPALAQDAPSPSAQEIVRSSRSRIESKTVSTRSRMVIAAKDGSATERVVDQYSSGSKGAAKTVVVFQKPASVANTRFLTVQNGDKEDDRWIFLPALGKVRRIAASEGSGSFMGTDMSYDDISSADRAADADDHNLLREEELNGKASWVIESKPKDSGYQYSRMVSWIDKESRIAMKIELYDRKGELVKLLEIQKAEDKQGRLTPTVTKMTTVKAKTSTTIYVDIIKYDDPIPATVFTTKFLETGRP
jgi:outer membrane lipoprotein-sorting protein